MSSLDEWRCNENVIANIKYVKVHLTYSFKDKNQRWIVSGKQIFTSAYEFSKDEVIFIGKLGSLKWLLVRWQIDDQMWEEWDLRMRSLAVLYAIKHSFSFKLLYFWVSVFRNKWEKKEYFLKSKGRGQSWKLSKLICPLNFKIC